MKIYNLAGYSIILSYIAASVYFAPAHWDLGWAY